MIIEIVILINFYFDILNSMAKDKTSKVDKQGGPSQGTRSKKVGEQPEKTPSVEVVKDDNPPPTSEQLREAAMEAKFKNLIAASIAEAMPAIITGAANAIREERKTEGGDSKNSKSKKEKSKKSKSREKTPSESESRLTF
jgi:hypothetical protein